MRWRRDHPALIVSDVLAAIGVLGIGAVLTGLTDRVGREPDLREVHGPFTIVTHHDSDDHYTLRHRGEPLTVTGRAGMFGDETATYAGFNAVVTWPDTTALARQQGRAVLVTCGVLTLGYAFAWLIAP